MRTSIPGHSTGSWFLQGRAATPFWFTARPGEVPARPEAKLLYEVYGLR